MTQELRALERSGQLSREDWITKFVNAIVRELHPGLDRMVAVVAAREAWPEWQGTSPFLAAKDWASKRIAG